MAVTAPPATTSKPSRPFFLSADKRKISYTSKSGKTLTVELRQSSKAITTLRELASRETKEELEAKNVDEGVLPGLFDTISFWCMEAVEIACFGPYDETRTIESPETAKVKAKSATVAAAA